MKRVLCLGNNTTDTDLRTSQLAKSDNLPNHGLLSDILEPVQPNQYAKDGYYHSSIYDIEFGRLKNLANSFDLVIMLDQAQDTWSHPDALLNTIRVMTSLDVPCEFQDITMRYRYDYWQNLVEHNKSFCIFPWIELMVNYDHTVICCRSQEKITRIHDLKDFRNDENYNAVRSKMMQGDKLPQHCNACYQLEDMGIISARQQETVEWANRLQLKSINDLTKITAPVYYEIRPSNRCNLQCRMCNPESSHLIEREYQKIGLIQPHSTLARYQTGFDIVNLEKTFKLYIAGGEPTVMQEFYKFLDDCVDNNCCDSEILVNTNGTNITQRFKKLLPQFKNFQFIFSIDGFENINHYIRWPSDWDSIIKNWKYLLSKNHKVMINSTISIYNISNLHLLYQFIDREFPNTLVHAQLVENPKHLSPLLYPDATKALDSLQIIAKTSCYNNDRLFASTIDGLIKYFQSRSDFDTPNLENFFAFNDLLDQSRNIDLRDYIPELEAYRS